MSEYYLVGDCCNRVICVSKSNQKWEVRSTVRRMVKRYKCVSLNDLGLFRMVSFAFHVLSVYYLLVSFACQASSATGPFGD